MTANEAVLNALKGKWRMAHEVRQEVFLATGNFYSEAGITARIRELRKPKFGMHNVQCRVFAREEGKRCHEYTV